jgi:hypothetical protein
MSGRAQGKRPDGRPKLQQQHYDLAQREDGKRHRNNKQEYRSGRLVEPTPAPGFLAHLGGDPQMLRVE